MLQSTEVKKKNHSTAGLVNVFMKNSQTGLHQIMYPIFSPTSVAVFTVQQKLKNKKRPHPSFQFSMVPNCKKTLKHWVDSYSIMSVSNVYLFCFVFIARE